MRIAILVLITGCTTLGPMPATTGISAVPMARPGGEAQLGPVPGFFLSSSAHAEAKGTPIMQLSGLVEPDRWLHVPGLIVGARVFGPSGDSPGEPYAGYRRTLWDGVSIGAVMYGTSKRSTQKLASYHATRFGGEAALDAKLWESDWFGLHVQGAVAATRIFASGSYCVDMMGIAKDCDEMNPATNTMVDGKQTGIYPAGTGTVARLALMFATGSMPMLANGTKTGSDVYAAGGLTLTLGIADN